MSSLTGLEAAFAQLNMLPEGCCFEITRCGSHMDGLTNKPRWFVAIFRRSYYDEAPSTLNSGETLLEAVEAALEEYGVAPRGEQISENLRA